ncbi:MAG: hypothetical protein PHD97_05365 [Bacteroidales bacterium]|nr:hypothetical protein [Bacteroidales bacterium]
MKINLKIILFFISFAFIQQLYSQDTILLLNGKQIYCKGAYSNETRVVYHKLSKNEKIKDINKEKVYSITDSLGKRTIIYDKDTMNGFYLTKEQMLLFIRGEQYAAKKFHTFFPFLASLCIGGLSAYSIPDPYGVAVVALVPFAYGSINAKSYKSNPNAELVNNQYFIQGYQTKVRLKKTKSSLIGGVFGYIAIAVLISTTK